MHGFVYQKLEDLPGWRFHHLSGHPVPLQHLLPRDYPEIQPKPPKMQFIFMYTLSLSSGFWLCYHVTTPQTDAN